MTKEDEEAVQRAAQSREMWDKALRDRQQKLWQQRQREEAAKAERKEKRVAANGKRSAEAYSSNRKSVTA